MFPAWPWGHVGRYNQAAGPPTPACSHTGAFNGRRSGVRLAPAVLTPRRRRGTDRGHFIFFSETPGISHD